MTIDCNLDIKGLKRFSEHLFSIYEDYKEKLLFEGEPSFEKLEKNGFEVHLVDSFESILNIVDDFGGSNIYYVDRFESAVIGSIIENSKPISRHTKSDLYEVKYSITYADLISLDTGSLFFLEDEMLTSLNTYPKYLYVVTSAMRLSPSFLTSYEYLYRVNQLLGNSNLIRVVNAPSRTGDIEKKIVYGAHGPKKVSVIFVNDIDLDFIDILKSYLVILNPELETCLNRKGYTLDLFKSRFLSFRYVL